MLVLVLMKKRGGCCAGVFCRKRKCRACLFFPACGLSQSDRALPAFPEDAESATNVFTSASSLAHSLASHETVLQGVSVQRYYVCQHEPVTLTERFGSWWSEDQAAVRRAVPTRLHHVSRIRSRHGTGLLAAVLTLVFCGAGRDVAQCTI